jgi:hypothetical protein
VNLALGVGREKCYYQVKERERERERAIREEDK